MGQLANFVVGIGNECVDSLGKSVANIGRKFHRVRVNTFARRNSRFERHVQFRAGGDVEATPQGGDALQNPGLGAGLDRIMDRNVLLGFEERKIILFDLR